jgi:alpha-L-fucosidase
MMIKKPNTNKTFNMRGKKIFSNLIVKLIFAGAFCFLSEFVLAQKPVKTPVKFDYKSIKVAGIKPLPLRIPKSDQGIEAQPNSKLDWFMDAKFGMFIHWGIYAGPARGEWVMQNTGMNPEEYRKFAYPSSGDDYFAADKYDPNEWAQLAKDAGMKYMSLTTMHHDGYALFDSKYMNAFTSKQTHNRDLVKEYVDACRSHGLKVGL